LNTVRSLDLTPYAYVSKTVASYAQVSAESPFSAYQSAKAHST